MAEYRLLPYGAVVANANAVLRLADNVAIPADPQNPDYQAFLAWSEDPENVPDPLPPPPAAADPARTLSPLDFIARFTDQEQATIAAAGQQSPQVMLWLVKLSGAQFIDPTDPRTIAGIDALITAHLLDPARRATVLAVPAP